MDHKAEVRFARSVVKAITDAGYKVSRVGYDGSGGVTFKNAPSLDKVMEYATATETGTIEFEDGALCHFVWFVWGNEEDVIGDYSMSFDGIISPMIDRLHASA